MARVKRGVTTRAKHKRILENAKGYYGRRKNTIRIARQAVEKAGQYAYRDRKVKKRSFRALWIQRINAAVRAEGLTYGQFIHALNLAGITLDRKVLADIAMHEARSVQRHHRAGEGRAGEEGGLSLRFSEKIRGVGRNPGALFLWRDRLPLQSCAVPFREVGGGVVGRLQELAEHAAGVGRRADVGIGQDELAIVPVEAAAADRARSDSRSGSG